MYRLMESVPGEEVGSEDFTACVGGKRLAINDGEVEIRSAKKAKIGGELRGNLKRVAEIVFVLETMGKMRGGRNPTQAEIEMMSEARKKLVEVCQEFAPKDVFPREAFGLVIDDIGLSKLNEQRLGFRPPNIPIADKLKLTQEKMEKSEEFAVHSASYSSQRWQTNVGAAAESGTSHAVRMLSSQKPIQAVVMLSSDKPTQTSTASVGFQPASPLANVSAANSTTLPYQLPTSEVRPVVSSESPSSYFGRDSSSLVLPRAESPYFRLDMKSNGVYTSQVKVNSPGKHIKPLTWSVQPLQSTSSVENASDSKVLVNASVKGEGAAEMSRVIPQTSNSFTSQTASMNPPSIQHIQQGMEPLQALSLCSKHTDIANIVQKLLQPKLHEHPIWTPPSRDYMNKSLTCQVCKLIINEVDNVLVCDGCEKGYHVKCLKIHNQKSVPSGEWHCGKCLSLSNGKALPPKYGRVSRNIITAPNVSSNATAVRIPSEKTLGPLVGKVTGNGKFGIQIAPSGPMDNNFSHSAAGVEMADKRVMHKEIDEKSSGCGPIDVLKTSADSSITTVGLSVETSDGKKLIAQSSSYPPADSGTVRNIFNSSINPSKNRPDTNFKVKDLKSCYETDDEAKLDEQGTLHTNHVEVFGTSFGLKEQDASLHKVDWIGDILKVVDDKTYYQSCSINGVVYNVHDHALFCSKSNILTPTKLQSMWEDNKTRSKWVIASLCYFPADLPKAVGRPFAPDNNEVYESNHDIAIKAGWIEGPCKVLPPRLFIESQRKTHLGMQTSGGLQPHFVCKWFFDIRKGLFRDVTS